MERGRGRGGGEEGERKGREKERGESPNRNLVFPIFLNVSDSMSMSATMPQEAMRLMYREVPSPNCTVATSRGTTPPRMIWKVALSSPYSSLHNKRRGQRYKGWGSKVKVQRTNRLTWTHRGQRHRGHCQSQWEACQWES